MMRRVQQGSHRPNDAWATPTPPGAASRPPDPSDDGRPPGGASRLLAALVAAVGVFLVVDLATDAREGASGLHVGFEVTSVLLAFGVAAWLWRDAARHRRRAEGLAVDLSRARAEAERWRAEAKDALASLGGAIDRQLDRWGLSPAEKEVAFLLLHGMSLAAIAASRHASERTVRQQAQSVYRKAGLAGRAELAAFFLEDLMVPPGPTPEGAG
jgi:DNA-binding CsgD family transcriptional regulator